MKTIGDADCQGAVFVYKDDKTKDTAWADVERINAEHGGIRGELHTQKDEFLRGLRSWESAVDPSNAFLCIYAHMGSSGINCVGQQDARLVSWAELADALPGGVECLWLVGCDSQECMKSWSPLSGPVRHILLATSESKPWRPLLKCFAAEISMKRIRFYDEMPDYLERESPELAKYTAYFRPTSGGFKPAFDKK